MPLQSGLKKAVRTGGVASAAMLLVAAWLSATTPNVLIVGATLVIMTVVLVVGALKFQDRYLRFLEAVNGGEPTKKGGKPGR
jgi:hypothetical protein